MDRLKTYIDALRVLARTNDPNRVVLIERNINNYLKRRAAGRSVCLSGCAWLSTMKRQKDTRGGLEHGEGLCWLAAAKHDVARLADPNNLRNRRDLAPLPR